MSAARLTSGMTTTSLIRMSFIWMNISRGLLEVGLDRGCSYSVSYSAFWPAAVVRWPCQPFDFWAMFLPVRPGVPADHVGDRERGGGAVGVHLEVVVEVVGVLVVAGGAVEEDGGVDLPQLDPEADLSSACLMTAWFF